MRLPNRRAQVYATTAFLFLGSAAGCAALASRPSTPHIDATLAVLVADEAERALIGQVGGQPVTRAVEGPDDGPWRVTVEIDGDCWEMRVRPSDLGPRAVVPGGLVSCPPEPTISEAGGSKVERDDPLWRLADGFLQAYLVTGRAIDRWTAVDASIVGVDGVDSFELAEIERMPDGALYARGAVAVGDEQHPVLYRLGVGSAADGRLVVTAVDGGGDTAYPTTSTSMPYRATTTSTTEPSTTTSAHQAGD